MAKVVVTRDKNGILVWKPGTQVQLRKLTGWDALNFWGGTEECETPVWTSKGLFRLLFNEKESIKYFPELQEMIQVWEVKELELTLIEK